MKQLFILLFLILSCFPLVTFGADGSGLVTCGYGDVTSGTYVPCDFCAFMVMVDRILNWLFGILVIIAVLLLVYAGFKLVISQGNSGAMTEAKGMITNVIIGFVIVMSGWLIVDTVMKALARTDSGAPIDIGMWNQIQGSSCQADAPTGN